ncbi:MAG: ribonuclease H-like domain-containing protein [Deltaproteobacteria bacterium]
MTTLIFDIETVGEDFEALDPTTQEHLLRGTRTEEERDKERASLGFHPVTARVVTVATIEAENERAAVYYLTPGAAPAKSVEAATEFVSAGTEKQLLEIFWARIAKVERFVTFNGRGFDCPFLLIRSAVNGVRPSKNLMPDRYRSQAHIDLMEKLTYLGAARRRYSLHTWCRAFGIASSKEGGVTGGDVGGLFAQGRYMDIARYCLRDVRATLELYRAWDAFLNLPG